MTRKSAPIGVKNKNGIKKSKLAIAALVIAILLTSGITPVAQNFGIGGEVWADGLEEPDYDYKKAQAALKELVNRVNTWESFSKMGRFNELKQEYDTFQSSAFTDVAAVAAYMCPFQEGKNLERFMVDNGIWRYSSEKHTCIQWYEHIKTLPIYANDADVAATVDDLIMTFSQRAEQVRRNFVTLKEKIQTEFPEISCNDAEMTCALDRHPFYELKSLYYYVEPYINDRIGHSVSGIAGHYAAYAGAGLEVDPKFVDGVDMPVRKRAEEIWNLFERIRGKEDYAKYRAVYDSNMMPGEQLLVALSAFLPMDELKELNAAELVDKVHALPMWKEWSSVFAAMTPIENEANGMKIKADAALLQYAANTSNNYMTEKFNKKVAKLQNVFRSVDEDSLPVMMTRLSEKLYLYPKFWDFVNASHYIEVINNESEPEEYRNEVLNSLRDLLKKSLSPDTEGIDTMTADELIKLVKALPDYDPAMVLVELSQKLAQENLWMPDEELAYFDKMPEDELLKEYTRVYTAMKVLSPEVLTGLTDYSIKVGNTGSTDMAGRTSAELIKGIVISVAVLALLCGGAVTAKRYLFSPLRRHRR